MTGLSIDALVVDVLGTLVDEPDAVRTAIRCVMPAMTDSDIEEMILLRQRHIEREQERIARGDRPYASSDILDNEAAELVADAAGIHDSASVRVIATATRRSRPWPDAARGLALLAENYPLIALSNASHASLLRLNAHAGLRWHQALSSESVGHYKPDPEIYRLAIETAGVEPDRLMMVAAHAWDLRGARNAGMRTAFVSRPVADPPTSADRFDFYADDLGDLEAQLRRSAAS